MKWTNYLIYIDNKKLTLLVANIHLKLNYVAILNISVDDFIILYNEIIEGFESSQTRWKILI